MGSTGWVPSASSLVHLPYEVTQRSWPSPPLLVRHRMPRCVNGRWRRCDNAEAEVAGRAVGRVPAAGVDAKSPAVVLVAEIRPTPHHPRCTTCRSPVDWLDATPAYTRDPAVPGGADPGAGVARFAHRELASQSGIDRQLKVVGSRPPSNTDQSRTGGNSMKVTLGARLRHRLTSC